jgi:hypothetical protein
MYIRMHSYVDIFERGNFIFKSRIQISIRIILYKEAIVLH